MCSSTLLKWTPSTTQTWSRNSTITFLTVFSNNRIVRFVIILYLNMLDYWHESWTYSFLLIIVTSIVQASQKNITPAITNRSLFVCDTRTKLINDYLLYIRIAVSSRSNLEQPVRLVKMNKMWLNDQYVKYECNIICDFSVLSIIWLDVLLLYCTKVFTKRWTLYLSTLFQSGMFNLPRCNGGSHCIRSSDYFHREHHSYSRNNATG